jgi:hypothetical protein
MTDTPHTVDDLLDLWDDHTAPCESMLRHPSAMELRTLRVIGSPWQAVEHTGGTWSFTCHGETIWGPMTGGVDDAFRLLLEVHRDPSPRAESQGRPVPDSDPLAPARGIILATAVMALVYAGVFAVLRWRGVL